MKKVLYNPFTKIISLILLFVLMYTTVYCGLKCLWLDEMGAYSDDFTPYQQLNIDSSEVMNIAREYINKQSRVDYNIAGKEVLDNVVTDDELTYPSDISEGLKERLESYRNNSSNFIFAVYFDHTHSNFADGYKFDKPMFSNTQIEYGNNYEYVYYISSFNSNFMITYGYNDELPVNDEYREAYDNWEVNRSVRYNWIYYTAASALITLLMLIFCLCQAGKRAGDDEVHLMWAERIPLEIALTAKALLFCLFCAVFTEFLYDVDHQLIDAIFGIVPMNDIRIFQLALLLLISFGMAAPVFWALRSFVKRARAGGWYRNTLCFMVLRFIWRILKAAGHGICSLIVNTRLTWKWTAVMAVYLLITIIAIGTQSSFVVLWVFASIVLVFTGYYYIIQVEKIRRGTEVIANGNIDSRITTDKMYGSLRSYAETLNHISDSIDKAVAEQMKSERMRTELITNVSHDLKTPLTSIISYVDLIKKENPENEAIREYIDVLDRQSRKLKKLTEDLLEASKASSGTIATELSETNAAELLTQAAGEYTERFAAANIVPALAVPEDGAFIMADGRHMWRVFDNLCSNICKYSLPNTRAYLTAEKRDGNVILTFRNISSEQLCIPTDSLTERFVRGDSSRHTEGSGLGLAIAKSLVELQKGSFELISDGDLFKVVLTFKEIKPQMGIIEVNSGV